MDITGPSPTSVPPAKPANLIYGVDDRVPPIELAVLTFQHVVLMSVGLVLPVVLIAETGGTLAMVQQVVTMSMIACGLGTILQAMRWRGIGSGFLCPNLVGPNFFMASLDAAWLGGLPLMRGMTIVAGLAELVFARALRHIRGLFPPEITGLVVLMVGVAMVPLSVSKFLGVQYEGDPISPMCLSVATLTLFVLVGMSVWGRGKLRLYGVLAGLVAGYAVSWAAGLLTSENFRDVGRAAWFALPDGRHLLDIEIRWTLVPTFIVVSLCGALKSFGNLVLCEKVNNDAWKASDVPRIGRGLMADGFCVTLSGLLGGMASDTSASNVSLSAATGATSRRVGFAAGALFAALGFAPKVAALLSVMPAAVMGAVMIYVISFMIVSGFQIVLSNKPNSRAIMVIGLSLIFGLSVEMLPGLYLHTPKALRFLTDSSLTMTTLLAVALNQILLLRDRFRRPAASG
jgi:NCS2 family nucleobase:cation symporter-2